jgi:hypothetical protein
MAMDPRVTPGASREARSTPVSRLERMARRWSFYLRDAKSLARYGSLAPKYAERIWVNPAACRRAIAMTASLARQQSGRVVKHSFPPDETRIIAVTDIEKVESCLRHWLEGVPWEETAMYRVYREKVAQAARRGETHRGLKNDHDVLRKCREYDLMFEQVKREGRLRTRKEIYPDNFREEGGVIVHVGPDGELFQGRSGNRRFAIALALGLPTIPATIGCVHQAALPYLPALRMCHGGR